MAFTIYDATVPTTLRALGSLSKILEKAVAQAKGDDKVLADLLEARLAPDMYPLPRQIHSASDGAKSLVARLAGVDVPSMPDVEQTFPELQQRIAKTVDFIKTIKPEQMAGAEDREIVLKFPNGEMKFSGRDFATSFALPNFFFHVTAAYAILRHKGIAIGKMDFLGG